MLLQEYAEKWLDEKSLGRMSIRELIRDRILLRILYRT